MWVFVSLKATLFHPFSSPMRAHGPRLLRPHLPISVAVGPAVGQPRCTGHSFGRHRRDEPLRWLAAGAALAAASMGRERHHSGTEIRRPETHRRHYEYACLENGMQVGEQKRDDDGKMESSFLFWGSFF